MLVRVNSMHPRVCTVRTTSVTRIYNWIVPVLSFTVAGWGGSVTDRGKPSGRAMGSEEERLLETQLELQLHEQRDSVTALKDAITSDPANPELLEVCPFPI